MCFIYVTLHINKKINSTLVLKYHSEIMMWSPEEVKLT